MLADGTLLLVDVVADTDPAVVRLSGELHAETAGSLVAAGRELVADGHRRVIVDCAGLLFCDSQGLNALCELRNLVVPEGSVTLRNPSDRLIQILRVTGLAQLFGVAARPR